MNIFALLILSLGLSMDAFAVAVSIGLSGGSQGAKKAIIVGLYFGIFQAVMPVVGFVAGALFTEFIAAYSALIAFVLLSVLGLKMIWGSFKKEEDSGVEASLSVAAMLPLALATSIDAMAVGVSFAFLQVNIVFAAIVIGIVTFAISALGVKIGNIVGARFRRKAEFAGGVILILIGVSVLF